MATAAPVDTEPYDEFAFLRDVAAEIGADPDAVLSCERIDVEVAPGKHISALRWGSDAPEFLFLHGGGQNAHTWDTLLTLLGRPAIAVDLPGHGRSDRRDDRDYGPWSNADVIGAFIDKLELAPLTLVGMSLGGATAIRLAAQKPAAFHHVVIIDVSPSTGAEGRTMTAEQRGSVALIGGPPTYESFDAMADATIAMSPLRTPEAVRRGVRHNAVRLEDGKWMWRYDLFPREGDPERKWTDFSVLWDDVARIKAPTMVVKGGLSVYTLPEDMDKYRQVLPSVRVEEVEGAGHAVQSDQPVALSALLNEFTK